MPIHTLTLISRREIAKNTLEFKFNKPDNLHFVPGQYAGFTLLHPTETDEKGITRRFSICSAPDDEHLTIAIRMQHSAYKRMLNNLKPGEEIKFAGPTGNFTLLQDTNMPAVFIAGGIGITPFYSMIQHAANTHSTQKMILLYGNQSIEETAYFNELQLLAEINPHFTFIPTFANPAPDWTGETGFITASMIQKNIPDLQTPLFYVCGSPAMVTTLQETLVELGIDEEKIKVEDFPGY